MQPASLLCIMRYSVTQIPEQIYWLITVSQHDALMTIYISTGEYGMHLHLHSEAEREDAIINGSLRHAARNGSLC